MKMKKLMVAGFATTMLLGAGNASAAIVATTAQASLTNNNTYFTTDWSKNLTFNKFDYSLGTLVGFKLSISTTQDTSLAVTNNSATASSGTANTRVTTIVNGLGYTGSLDGNQNIVGGLVTTDVSSANAGYSLAAGGTTTVNPAPKSAAETTLLGVNELGQDYLTAGLNYGGGLDATLVNYLSGMSGSYVLNAFTTSFAQISNTGGNTSAIQTTLAKISGTVTYYYDNAVPYTPPTVPLPGAVWLFGTGIAGLVGASKRKKTKAALTA